MKTQSKQKKISKDNIQNVPANIMKPRILFILVVLLLTSFGLLMIYSSSSVLALGSEQYGNNPNFFIKKQLISLAIAIVMCIATVSVDYHKLGLHTAKILAVVVILVLIYTRLFGVKALGASRWIIIPGIGLQLQPSEFVKPYLVFAAAFLIKEIVDTGSSIMSYWKEFSLCIVVPAAFILFQPDKGTTIVIGATILYMFCAAGIFNRRQVHYILVALLIVGLFLGIYSYTKQEYGSIRIKAFLNPWAYKDNEAYQIVQGYYAFAQGGIFGKGIGYSSQKYAYLPMAYNDFIYAIVGEEFGLFGTVGVLVAFFYFYRISAQIARTASDLYGKLIVIGASIMIVAQFLLNVVGVIGLMPSSGKPIPFISYGGSSIMGTYILVGMILNVSMRSKAPETRYDRRRNKLSVVQTQQEFNQDGGFRVVEGAGEPTPRRRRGRRTPENNHETSRSSRRSRENRQPQSRTGRRRASDNHADTRASRPERTSRRPRR